ncbi:TIGR02444 family protein [Aquabacter sp. L1I39]|uniref:TIGR02444 family protein n=1 Tax=Aquabacter sp. L1I39 TaxID=2820278 RepID=UPI001ADAB326|nr:TIGR02444 family protein [Aquabacter sp. L1I39]QTL02194.1 TIGR02444 family protein [Aquabacter sp. L1I39]
MADEPLGLKEYALVLYAREGVSSACLLLQDATGLDVNLLLFAAWRGAVLRQAIGRDDIAVAHARVADWHGEVVRPLRAVRRRLKTGPAPAPSDRTAKLREKLQALEIAAEIIELEELGALLCPGDAQPGPAEALARAGILAVAEAAAGRPLTPQEKDAAAWIARAAGTETP